MKRQEVRRNVYQLLFVGNFNEQEEMKEQIEAYLSDNIILDEEEKSVVEEQVMEMVKVIPELDKVINDNCSGWSTSRMNKADLTALRYGVYDMMYRDEIPSAVAINEAVKLAKKFGGEQSGSFVNGVLAKIIKVIDK